VSTTRGVAAIHPVRRGPDLERSGSPDELHVSSKLPAEGGRSVASMLATTTVERTRARRRDATAGARAMVPWLLGVAPYGLVIGVSAAQADIPTAAGWLTGLLIYSGSAQVATIELLDAGAASLVVVATALAIHMRLIIYSGAMAGHWRGTSLRWRALAAYLLVDPSFAVGVDRYQRSGDRSGAHAHYLGGAVALWVTWMAAIATGGTLGARLPVGLHLEFVIPLFLVGEVVVRLGTPAIRRASLTAVAVAVAGYSAPLHVGLVGAIVAGIAVGLATPRGPR
jgi:predicted branched-subunit amino acid permease